MYLEMQQKKSANTIDFSERCFLQMKKTIGLISKIYVETYKGPEFL